MSSSISNENPIPCWLASKHSTVAYPGKVVINEEGLHLMNHDQNTPNSLLLYWSFIFRWEHEFDKSNRSVFIIHVVGLVHPNIPNNPTHHEHSYYTNGFIRDACLDHCCLTIIPENQYDSDSLVNAMKKFAWCSQKSRGNA